MKYDKRFLMKNALLCTGLLLMTGCGDIKSPKSMLDKVSGSIEEYESSDVNAVQQALPQIMVIPSDMTLKNFGALSTQVIDGRSYLLRDYRKYFLADDRASRVLSTIQNAFLDKSYPLADFEQMLKQLDTQEATDLADDIEKDSKTQLLMAAHPDIILEWSYDTSRDKQMNMMSHNYKRDEIKNVSYTLDAIDAYTNKVVATITASNMKGNSTTEVIQDDIKKQLPGMMEQISAYFSDILERGREITVRVAVEKGSNISLSDESIEGDTYADWIMDYIKSHTVKGAYKMQRNTDMELYFVNCRIKLLNEDGTQYGVYDWARDLAKNLRKNLGVKVSNKAQGLGEVLITIEELK